MLKLASQMSASVRTWFDKEHNPIWIIFLVTIFILLADNFRFFSNLFQKLDGSVFLQVKLVIVVGMLVFAMIWMLLTFFAFPRFTKPFLIAMLMVAAVCSYFIDNYKVVINEQILLSIVETNANEAYDLLTMELLIRILILGLLPSFVIYKLKFKRYRFFKHSLIQFSAFAGGVILVLANAGIFYKDLSILFREHRDIRYYTNPTYPMLSLYSVMKAQTPQTTQAIKLVRLSDDAMIRKSLSKSTKKTLLIFVLGETARSQAFSLGGYKRDTNKFTKKEQVIYFNQVVSCGTATSQSLPCMFSDLGQHNFSVSKASARENILDILQHAGVHVIWRENNTGCKGVCTRVNYEELTNLEIPKYCNDGQCRDEILLDKLQEKINKLNNNTLIVLHQIGSHGPAFFKNYPEKFAKFKPECREYQVVNCSSTELLNSYDNSILYTDYFLYKTIRLLKANSKKFNVAMLYLSDHGESLGESGVYLHGLPYAIAPKEQTSIPMILWMSDKYTQENNIDSNCVKKLRAKPYSHDNLYHTLLGVFDVESHTYKADKDILSDCRVNKNIVSKQ